MSVVMKKFAAVFVMGLFVVMNVLGAEEVPNTATLYWTGADVAFGVNSTTNASKWEVYKKVSGSSEKEEALPIVDPAEEGAQYSWSGVKAPLNGGALTNSVNWDIKLIDAGKVPRTLSFLRRKFMMGI